MLDIDLNRFAGADSAAPIDEFPDILTYEDVRQWLWNSRESELLLGVDGTNESVTVDLASDTPHVLASGGSGGGKSTLAASMATQALVKGATAVFLDIKRISHRWAKNLPQVHYASEVTEMASAIVSVAVELHRRMKVIEDYPGGIDDAPIGPRIVLIAEELNQMMAALKAFEKDRPKGEYGPMRAFGDIINLGRAAKIHVVGFAQFPNWKVLPAEWLESFGYRVLLQHTYRSWNLLVDNASGPCPQRPRQKGRGYVVMGDRRVQTQLLYLTEPECAQLVRDAYEARERMGLVPTATRKERRQMDRGARQKLRELERGIR
jgi:hypothetical protein